MFAVSEPQKLFLNKSYAKENEPGTVPAGSFSQMALTAKKSALAPTNRLLWRRMWRCMNALPSDLSASCQRPDARWFSASL